MRHLDGILILCEVIFLCWQDKKISLEDIAGGLLKNTNDCIIVSVMKFIRNL